MKSVYEMVTNRIIEQLEKGVIPWHKPWTGTINGAYNRISNKSYSLLNQMLLKHAGEYATFKQWDNLGGHIKRGAKSEIVVFWKIQQVEEIQEDGTKEVKNISLLRYYNVFHISQVEGVEPRNKNDLTENEPIAAAENIKDNYKARENIEIIETILDRAYYSPAGDYIKIPAKEQYKDIEEFYSTLFHEMIHSTGHKTRLNRLDTENKAMFGNEVYSKEELVAELGSAMLLNMLNIETSKTFKNSAAYIQNWLQVLKNDSRFIVSASSKAEKAVNYILSEA